MPSQLPERETSSGRKTVRFVSRRTTVATIAGGVTAIAAPALIRAQSALSVKFVQQRGLLYLPVDMMVTGGVLQKEADKLGLGKVEASVATLSGPGPVIDAVLSGSADYGTAALPSLVTLWDKTHGRPNEVRAVGTVSNGAMTLYTINPKVKAITDFSDDDRIAVPTVGLSFNAIMLQMAAEKQWNDPHRLDHLTVSLGHPDAVAALSAGYGKAIISAHIGVEPYTEQGLKLPGAHVITDSREVFGGTLTQVVLLATKTTRERNPILFKAVGNALKEAIRVANADKGAAAVLWKQARNANESLESIIHLLSDPGFEFTSQPHRIAVFTAFSNRIGSIKTAINDWRDLFWETPNEQTGDQ
jgi:NitT/TauT family transport system substrate-binding protein